MLTAYEQLLKEWKECYAPSEPESDWDARFIVACNVLPQVSYMLACLTSAIQRNGPGWQTSCCMTRRWIRFAAF